MNRPEQPNDLQIIASYIARRDRIADLTKAFEAAVAPYKQQMKTLENEMLRRLLERGAEHSNTEIGTAYKEQTLQVKCEDKEAFHHYAIDHYDTFGKDLLTAHVGKEALKLVIDKSKNEAHPNGVVPPGLAVSFETVVRFRKA
jgi:hypothetical protein